ncbi:MAG: hypothetical protein V4721_16495 [Bacteroidota bacterium]
MNLHEGPDDITNVLKEEPEAPGAAGSAAAINAGDFSVETLEIPQTPAAAVQEQKTAAAAPAAQAAAPAANGEIKKEVIKTTTGPDGEKIVEKTIIQSAPTSEKSEAVARLFNTDTTMLMFDIFMTRLGGILTPDRPREYWSLTVQDKKDLGLLLKESAKEEGWTGVPTKYLFFGAMGLMIGGKVVYAKKLDYKFVPGERSGDPKGEAAASGEQEKKSESIDYKALFTREKARYEVEVGVKNNSEEVKELKRKNDMLEELLNKIKKKEVPGGGVSDADYVMLRKDQQTTDLDPEEDKDHIFQDSQGKVWNLDNVEFTDQAAIRDKTKAGLSGWSPTGIKLGSVSAGQHEAFAEWKKYRKRKKIAA